MGKGQILHVNDAYRRIWYRSPEALYEDRRDWEKDIDPDDRAKSDTGFALLIEVGAPFDVVYRVRDGQGRWRWAHDRAWLVPGDSQGVHFVVGITRDITAQKAAEARQKLLMGELGHRLKNTLATVLSISRDSIATSSTLNEYDNALNERVLAYGRAHDLLVEHNWGAVPLDKVARRTLSPYLAQGSDRLVLDGPALQLERDAAIALNMAFHELATNAAKYGALSTARGRLTIRWSIDADQSIDLDWLESEGPPVVGPSHRGFGSRLLKRVLASLGGRVSVEYPPSGCRCRIFIPVQRAAPK